MGFCMRKRHEAAVMARASKAPWLVALCADLGCLYSVARVPKQISAGFSFWQTFLFFWNDPATIIRIHQAIHHPLCCYSEAMEAIWVFNRYPLFCKNSASRHSLRHVVCTRRRSPFSDLCWCSTSHGSWDRRGPWKPVLSRLPREPWQVLHGEMQWKAQVGRKDGLDLFRLPTAAGCVHQPTYKNTHVQLAGKLDLEVLPCFTLFTLPIWSDVPIHTHTLAQKHLIELLMWNASYVHKHFS